MSNSPTMKEALIFSNNPLAKAEFFQASFCNCYQPMISAKYFLCWNIQIHWLSIRELLKKEINWETSPVSFIHPLFDFCRVSCVSILVPHMPCVGAHQLLLLVVTKELSHMEKKVISLSRIELCMWSIARNFSLTFYLCHSPTTETTVVGLKPAFLSSENFSFPCWPLFSWKLYCNFWLKRNM